MPTQTLGKVKLTPRGEYDPAATYVPLDIVSYGGGSYCVLKNVTGITPAGDDVNYQLLAESGADGKSPQISTSKTWLVWNADSGAYKDTGVSAAGEKGDDGNPGKAPIIGSNGNWYVWDETAGAYTDTGKPSRGEKGNTGAAGADGNDGRDGTDGITPTIGENGNWYLGDTDTGKPSRGADGATGATGATGEKGADGKSAYAYAVEGGYTGTETEFTAKLAEEFPEKLPNPNALTFTGAVTGSYDGSVPLSVEIPSGGGSGSDISLGLTGAAAGQIAKITAVDDTGKPTAWEAVDMPTGGSSEDMHVIKTITITAGDVNSVYFNNDDNGLPFALTKHIRIRMYGAATNTGSTQAVLFFRAGQTNGDISQSHYPIKVNSNNTNYIFDFVWDLYSAVNCWYGDFATARSGTSSLHRYVPSGDNNSSDITVREIKLVWSNSSVFFQQGATIVVEGI